MPLRTLYFVQQFEFVRGQLVEVRRVIFPSSAGAISRAGYDAPHCVGIIALQQDLDAETGELEGTPVVLAKFGKLPQEFDGE